MNIIICRNFFGQLLTFLGIIAGISQLSFAQCPLSITISYTPVQQLSLADVDFDHFESKTLLFTMNIKNSSAVPATSKINITLNIKLADGTPIDNPALTFISKVFEIPVGGLTITNLDIGRSGRIQKEEYTLTNDAKNKVQDIALATGKFPAGMYRFNFQLINTSCGAGVVIEGGDVVFEFSNPSRVELRSPRDGEITNEFPIFEFFSDGNRNVLTVAEKSPDQSREDALSHEPPMNKVDLLGQNSFLYSGGRPLEQGKTYVWKVVNKTHGPSGTDIEVSSLIGIFTVSSSPQSGPEDTILKILEEIFGGRYPTIFAQIHRDNFTLMKPYTKNGSNISQDELLKLLNELLQNSDNVELSFE